MGQYTKGCGEKVNEKVKENSFGLMDLLMKANSKRIKFKALEYIYGINGEDMKGIG